MMHRSRHKMLEPARPMGPPGRKHCFKAVNPKFVVSGEQFFLQSTPRMCGGVQFFGAVSSSVVSCQISLQN